MAELIYSTTLTGFSLQADSTTVYEAAIAAGAPSIAKGTIYTILWDGKRYVCAAEEGKLGNEILSGSGMHSSEPFLYMDNGDGTGKVLTSDTETSHDIAIYEGQDNPDGYLMYERTIPCTQLNADGNVYGGALFAGAPVLTVGNTYTVIWDGVKYVCTAEGATIDDMSTVCVGNLSIAEAGATTEEPFLYTFVPDYGIGTINTLSTEAEHVVSVYDGELEEEGVGEGEESDPNMLLNDTFQFSYNSDIDAYLSTITDNPPAIVAGNTYTVTWGTRRYVCTAYNGTIAGGENTWNAIYLGNNSIIGTYATGDGDPSDANLPFLYAYVPEQSAGSTTITSSGNFYTPDFAPVYDIKLYNGLDNPDGYLMYQLTLTFEKEESESHYNYAGNGMPAITADKVYTVVWDGKFFTRTAYSITDPLAGEMICLGSTNIADESYEDTEEPFLYAYATQSDSGYAIFGTLNNSSEHIVSIYEGELKPSVENKSLYFDTDASSGKLTANLSNPFMPVEAGDTYVVTWDENEEFTCTAKEAVVPLYGIDTNCVVLGNLSIADESADDTKEPFLYAYCADEVTCEYNLTEPGVYTEAIGYTWYKISDATPSYEQILDAELTLSAGGETPITGSVTASQCLINDYRGCAFMIESEGLGFIVSYCSGTIEHTIATIDIPEKGFYLAGPPVDNFIQFSGGLKASNFAWFTIPETSENEHIVSMRAADTTQPDEPSDPNLPENVNIVLLDKTGAPVVYYGIKTVSFDTDVTGQRATFILNKISGGE